ncbi:MAG: hypothetical protein WC456_02760 [Patescibacteria group bacterium]
MKKIIFFIIGTLLISIIPARSVWAQENQAILYYGDGCPHCAEVEDFIKNNSFDFSIERKEIYQNKTNAEEFNQICATEGISLMNRGVPFLYAENECFIGDKQIISYLSAKQKSIETDTPANNPDNIKIASPNL